MPRLLLQHQQAFSPNFVAPLCLLRRQNQSRNQRRHSLAPTLYPYGASANPRANPPRADNATSGSSPALCSEFLPTSPAHPDSTAPLPSACDLKSHRRQPQMYPHETAGSPSPSLIAPRQTKTDPFAHPALPHAPAPATCIQMSRPCSPAASDPPTLSP